MLHEAGIELHGRAQGFMGSLKAASQELDDIQRDMLIEATFKVAAADGIMKVSNHAWLPFSEHGLRRPFCALTSVAMQLRALCASTASSMHTPAMFGCPQTSLASQSQEIDVLAQVASALGIPAIIIELRVFEYREELASRGRSINRPSSQVTL